VISRTGGLAICRDSDLALSRFEHVVFSLKKGFFFPFGFTFLASVCRCCLCDCFSSSLFPLPPLSLSTLSLSDIYRRCVRFWYALSTILEAFSEKRDGLFVFSLYAETVRSGVRYDWKFWILKQDLDQLCEWFSFSKSFAGTFAIVRAMLLD